MYNLQLQPFQVRWLHKVKLGNSEEPASQLTVEDLDKITWIRPFQFANLGDVRMFHVQPGDMTAAFNRVHWNGYLKQKYSGLSLKDKKMIADNLPKVFYYYIRNTLYRISGIRHVLMH